MCEMKFGMKCVQIVKEFCKFWDSVLPDNEYVIDVSGQ